MRVPGNARQRWLAFLLAVSLALSGWTWRRQQLALSMPVPRTAAVAPAPSQASPAPAEAPANAEPLMAPVPADVVADPFAVTQWLPAAPPEPPPPPPAPVPEPVVQAPVAPPLPFGYLGRQEPASGPAEAAVYYLTQGSESLAVRAGETIGADYRFEGADAQGRLRFVYLPLDTQQLLSIGEPP